VTLGSEITGTAGGTEPAAPLRAGSIIGEADFRVLVETRLQPLFQILALLRSDATIEPSKRLLWRIREETHTLETFLDDYGARLNRTYGYLAEVMSSVRSFARAIFEMVHIRDRYHRYSLLDGPDERERILADTEVALRTSYAQMLALLSDAETDAIERIGMHVGGGAANERDLVERPPTMVLPHDVDEGAVLDGHDRVAEIASKYLRVAENWRKFELKPMGDPADRRRFVRTRYNEEQASKAHGVMLSLQARYDTYIAGTSDETPQLATLRGHLTMSLHLFAVAAHLVHFYERHENDIRFEAAKARIASVVPKQDVVDCVVSYCLRHAGDYLLRGEPLARELLRHNLSEREQTLAIPESVAFHARPASLIVRVVNHYGTEVEIEMGGQSADARSITNVLLLAGTFPGAREVTFRGDEKPLDDLRLLFEHELGERGLEHLPERLGYLLS